jgi:tRNA A37 methylthiotransferase MiaB
LDVVDAAKFIHIHAFSFSPRPGTAAARWTGEFVHGPVVNERIDTLRARATEHSYRFRQSFVGQTVQILVEQGEPRHGRCERYFDVHIDDADARPGDFHDVRIDRVTPTRTFGTVLQTLEFR